MITIRKDQNLQDAADLLGMDWQVLANELVRIIQPDEDYFVGYNLEMLMEETGYSLKKILVDLHIRPTIKNMAAVGKLTLWYEDADNPCSRCGYELIIDENATIDDQEGDEDGSTTLVGRCPICNTITLLKTPV